MYRKVSLSSFHNGKVEYCATSGSGDIEENASAIFFTQTLCKVFSIHLLISNPFSQLLSFPVLPQQLSTLVHSSITAQRY